MVEVTVNNRIRRRQPRKHRYRHEKYGKSECVKYYRKLIDDAPASHPQAVCRALQLVIALFNNEQIF